jgi:hypothetical protein
MILGGDTTFFDMLSKVESLSKPKKIPGGNYGVSKMKKPYKYKGLSKSHRIVMGLRH